MTEQTTVAVDGHPHGWLSEAGTYYLGDRWSSKRPVAEVSDEGRVTIIRLNREVGFVGSSGDIRQSPYDPPMGHVDGNGTVRRREEVVAHCEGPDIRRAAAAYLLLELHEEAERAKPSWGQVMGEMATAIAAAQAARPPEDPTSVPAAKQPMSAVPDDPWKPGDPYLPRYIPDPDGPGPRGLFGRGPKRAGVFKVGDRVSVETLSFYGTGTILDISDNLERGYGSTLYPSFLVEFDEDGRRGWFNGISIKKLRR